MKWTALELDGVGLVDLDVYVDDRGQFSETYDAEKLRLIGIDDVFVLDCRSVTQQQGTLRGLHFQAPPHAQAKLVRVNRGRILDVIVDLRRASPMFGKSIGVELSAARQQLLYVPVGFGHGFCTLSDDVEIAYKLSAVYAPASEGGVLWSDPDLGIDWPMPMDSAIVSEKDLKLPRLADLPEIF